MLAYLDKYIENRDPNLSNSNMPYYASSKKGTKRRRITPTTVTSYKSNFGGTQARIPRPMSSNTCIIPLRINFNIAFAADPVYGFGWTTAALWVNQVSVSAIPGATELAAVFDLMRIVKVECCILPGCNMLGYDANGATTGTRNIPYAYNAFDANDGSNPANLSDIQQLSSCKVQMLDKPVRRTIYPKLNDDSVIQTLDRGQFVKAGNNVIPWYGWKVFLDMENTALTYDIGRCEFKVFYECRSSK